MFRLLIVAVALTLSLAGCSPAETTPPEKPAPIEATSYRSGTTPEETVKMFIQAQRDGDLAAARATIYPDDTKYSFEGVVVIQNYQILGKKTLTATEAAEYTETPPRAAGDVVIDTWEEYEGGRTSEITYFLREYDGEWRIYSLSFTL